MLISLYSPGGVYDAKFLANYAYINLNDQLTRVPGIGSVQVFGAGRYAMRLWVKPDQLAKLAITVPDIVTAIQSQNTVNPAGQIGGEPAPKGQEFTYSVRAQGRLTSPEEFEQIVVRATPDGGIVRVKDVARVELGAQDYTVVGHLNGQPERDHRGVSVARIECRASSRRGQDPTRRAAAETPARRRLQDRAGYHARGHRRHQRDRRDAVDRHRPGDRRGLRLPAGMARNPHPAAGRPGLAGGDVRRVSRCSAFPSTRCRCSASFWPSVWSSTTPSSWWRRSSITSRKGCAEGRDVQSDGRDLGPVVGIALVLVRGVHSHRIHPRNYRAPLSAVRGHHRDLRLPLGLQCPHVEPRPVGVAAAAAAQERWSASTLLRLVQPRFRARDRRLRASAPAHSSDKSAVAFALLRASSASGPFSAGGCPSSFLPDEDQGYMFLNLQLPNAASLQRTEATAQRNEKTC